MQTLQISDEAASNLSQLAQREHVSSTELIELLIKKHSEELRKHSGQLSDFAGILAGSPSFTESPLDIQKAMRNEWD